MSTLNDSTNGDVDNGAEPEDVGWTEFAWYVGGHSAYFLAMGIQSVVYPFLVTFVLQMDADWIGIAQMFTMLPMFGLVLFGGMTADRTELRMHLIRLQFLAAMPMLVLATLVLTDTLTYTGLVLCGTATGCVSAFVMPARDSLLSRVALRSPSGDIQQAVSVITGIQFAAQLFGILIGRFAPAVGAGFILLSMVLGFMLAAFCTSHVRPAPPGVRARRRVDGEASWRRNLLDIREGLLVVRHSERMLSVVTMIFFGGLFLMGVFSVHLQVLVRDVYQGGIAEYSAIMMTFMIGVTASTTILSRLSRHILHQGRVMMIAFSGGAVVMLAIYMQPPLWMIYVLLFVWGSTAGVTMTMSRAIIQEAAEDSHRARVMSVFQLGFLGGAPIGSLAMGLTTATFGAINAALFPLIGIVVVWIGLFFLTDLWRLKRAPSPAA